MNMIGSVSSQALAPVQPTSATAKPADHQRDHTHDGDHAPDHAPDHGHDRGHDHDATAFATGTAKAPASPDPQHPLNTTA
jgi:Cd2+/Zn2+-exporting ATPase